MLVVLVFTVRMRVTWLTDQLGWPSNEEAFRRRYEHFNLERKINVRFPVQSTEGIDGPTTLAAGERCVVRLAVGNLSRIVLGSRAQPKARAVRVRWHVVCAGNPAASAFADLRDESGAAPGSFPVEVDMPNLPAAGTDVAQAQFGWRPGTPDLTKATLHATIGLEALSPEAWEAAWPSMRWPTHGSNEPKIVSVQRRAAHFVCVPDFAVPSGLEIAPAAAILLFSPGAPTELSRYGIELLRSPDGLGLSTAVWDVQRKEHFDPNKDESLASMVSSARALLVDVLNFAYSEGPSENPADRFVDNDGISRTSSNNSVNKSDYVRPTALLSKAVLSQCFPSESTRFLVVSGVAPVSLGPSVGFVLTR